MRIEENICVALDMVLRVREIFAISCRLRVRPIQSVRPAIWQQSRKQYRYRRDSALKVGASARAEGISSNLAVHRNCLSLGSLTNLPFRTKGQKPLVEVWESND